MRKFLFAVSSLILSAAPSLANTEGKVRWTADLPAAMKLASAQKKPVLLEFYFETCIWCNKMGREAFIDPKLLSTLQGKYVPVHIDGKKDEAGKKSAADHGISGYPTFIILDAGGKEVDRRIGYLKPADMTGWLEAAARGEETFAAVEAAYKKAPGNAGAIAAYAGKLGDRNDAAAVPLYEKLAGLDPDNRAGHREDALAALSQSARLEESKVKDGPTAKEEGFLLELQKLARKPDNLTLAYHRMAKLRFRAAKAKQLGPAQRDRLNREGLEFQRLLTEKLQVGNPDLSDSLNDYAYYLLEVAHDIPAATVAAEKAVKLERDPNYLDTLASCYGEQGRWADALKLQREALALDPANADLQANLKSREKKAAEHGVK